MKNGRVTGFALIALLTAAGSVGFSMAQGVETAGARLLELNGVAGNVEVRTSRGAEFNVEIIPGRKMTAEVERDGTTLRIKGPLGANTRSNCGNWGAGNSRRQAMTINGTRYEPEDLPRIIISGPDSMGLRIKRSLIGGSAGNVGGATIDHSGCNDFALGNVARDLEASVSGSGDFQAGAIGGRVEANLAGSGDVEVGNVGQNLELNVAGSGDTRIGQVGGKSKINLAGSGDVQIASVESDTEVNIAGSGDVTLGGGRTQLSANIAGSGNVRHNGIAINPEVSIVGSGDVIVARLEGRPTVSKLGSGEFRVN
jgi:Putative auto-transporter adhesin, head GIN domain